MTADEAAGLTDRGVLVLLDQAYADYLEPERVGLEPWVRSGAVLFRTMSKFRNRGDLRVGWAVAAPETIARMRAGMLPFPCSAGALRAARDELDRPPLAAREAGQTAARLAALLRAAGHSVSHTDGLPWTWCHEPRPPTPLEPPLSDLVRVAYRFADGDALKV
jgi:histidinol-phosphate/aromatic aminotransferase/cobyric acid decarboxylase-like protein